MVKYGKIKGTAVNISSILVLNYFFNSTLIKIPFSAVHKGEIEVSLKTILISLNVFFSWTASLICTNY